MRSTQQYDDKNIRSTWILSCIGSRNTINAQSWVFASCLQFLPPQGSGGGSVNYSESHSEKFSQTQVNPGGTTGRYVAEFKQRCSRLPYGFFPDNSNPGPLPPFNSDLDTINIASAAGLRTLEFGTNFQRRSANLIGQNPLIVASTDNSGISGSAAGDENEIARKIGVMVSAFGAQGDEQSSSLGTDIDWDTTATALFIDYAFSAKLFVGVMVKSGFFSQYPCALWHRLWWR